ncbi:PadR family transcriptional regulator [Rhodanobacter aciditrophus]|uniref:PadR family transcriptional regulator n=1 Tax=Rhodanobacter aciditrophus TaxID=1623218 RepID=UPI003CE805BF
MRMHHFFSHLRHHHHHDFPMDQGGHGCHAGRHGPFGEHHGGGAFGGWDGLRGGGRRGGGGRMFGHGDLKLLLLALIEQQPRHGYELIRIIEEMFHGQYTPSPGAIYPTLAMLEDMGYAQVESEAGNRKLYAITEAGRAFLNENRAAVDAATSRTEHSARLAAKMAAPMAVRKAMHALKHALLMRTGWDKAEAERVAAILQRAASEVAAGKSHD